MKRESELAKELGVNRDVLVAYRNGDMPRKGWKRSRGAVWVTKMGEEWIHEQLGSDIGVELAEFEAEPGAPREMTVKKRPLNPRMVLCDLDGEEVKVRVRSNENFLVGMKLKARPPAPDSRMWVLEGRGPRWRGKW